MGCLKLQDIRKTGSVLKLAYSSPLWSESVFQDSQDFPNSPTSPGVPAHPFAFNGKEKDDETYGEGDEYDFGARMYDARVGRFLSTDPMDDNFPELSTYSYAANSPILLSDIDGEFPSFAWLFGGEAHKEAHTVHRRFTYSQFHSDHSNSNGKAPVSFSTTVGGIKRWGTTMNEFINEMSMKKYAYSTTIVFSSLGETRKNHSNQVDGVPEGTPVANTVYTYNIAGQQYVQNSTNFGPPLSPRLSVSTSDRLTVNINRGAGIFGNTDGCYNFSAHFDVHINFEKTWYVHVFRLIDCPSPENVENDPNHKHKLIFIYSQSADVPTNYLRKWNKQVADFNKRELGSLKDHFEYVETSEGMHYNDAKKWKDDHPKTGVKPD